MEKKKEEPDIPFSQRASYQQFITQRFGAGLLGLKHIFTRKQLSMALKMAGVTQEFTPGEVLYIQWLCLYRCCQEHSRINL
jgi:23S rRNA (adenine-N6)-dimethyltransferase